jgi:methionyl-tRNA synthetase
MKKYYITTPIYYVNDSPHIGHAYTSLACDVIARFKRADGYEVCFLTGTDEHGQKVEKAAHKVGLNPQDFTDTVSVKFRELSNLMGFSNNDFIRTSENRHKNLVKSIWNKLLESDNIYLGKYRGWYSVRDEAFYAESELIDGKAPTGAEVEWLEEPSYFFKLSAWADKLLDLYENNVNFIKPESKRNEVISFVKSGLNDLSISRTSFEWGIPVPRDESHIIYVWLDALFNYYSAINSDNKKDFWPPDLHVVGKDILRFHAVYWPAFLMAAGLELPKQVFAHGWWTIEGEKMSKSLGNVVSPADLVKQYGVDYSRYFLMREMPFGNDGNFSRNSLINRVNAELCNNVGNLVQRVLSFIHNNCDAKVPDFENLEMQDRELLDKAYSTSDKMRYHIDNLAIHSAFEEVIKISSLANEYVNIMAPWNLKNIDTKRMNQVLYVLLECIRVIGVLLQPLIPASAEKILNGLSIKQPSFKTINFENAMVVGTLLPKPKIIFPKIQI